MTVAWEGAAAIKLRNIFVYLHQQLLHSKISYRLSIKDAQAIIVRAEVRCLQEVNRCE